MNPLDDLNALADEILKKVGMTPEEISAWELRIRVENSSSPEEAFFAIFNDYMASYEYGSKARKEHQWFRTIYKILRASLYHLPENKHRVIPAIMDRYCLHLLNDIYTIEDIAAVLEVLREDFEIE